MAAFDPPLAARRFPSSETGKEQQRRDRFQMEEIGHPQDGRSPGAPFFASFLGEQERSSRVRFAKRQQFT
jgi:hypothetical protein